MNALFRVRDGLPYTAISYEIVARYRTRIEYNHVATLEALHESGGLDWIEFYCGFNDLALFPAPDVTTRTAREAVLRVIEAG